MAIIKGIIILISIILSSGININCSPSVHSNSEAKSAVNETAESSRDYCLEWERIVDLLSESQKMELKKEGILLGAKDGKYDYSYYVLDSNLVSDCERRIRIGRFVRKVISGQDDGNDLNFAKQNSGEIIKVLQAVWNSPNFSTDGVISEKYSLLTYQGIEDKDAALLIGQILDSEGLPWIDGEIESVLINRPISSLVPNILRMLKKAEREKNIPQQIFLLIVLQQTLPKPENLQKLEMIRKYEKLSFATKAGIKKILEKFDSGKKIEFQDVENLNIELTKYDS